MNLKSLLSTILLFFTVLGFAEVPIAKVDINMEGRSANEVNEPGYTSWFIPRVSNANIEVSGITFQISSMPEGKTAFRSSWSKALVQSPYYTRLANDGIKIDNDSLLKHPGITAGIKLKITGLPVGKHTLQTYHNIWEDTTKVSHSLLSVYVNGKLVHNKIKRSAQVKKNTDATLLMTELEVLQAGQEILIEMLADTNFVATKPRDLNVCINGFELNTDDASRQAREPLPANGDLHADADNGSFTLGWKSNITGTAVKHDLYFGTDSIGVAGADKSSPFYKSTLLKDVTNFVVSDLYNMNKYFWRVDEVDSAGTVFKGKIWSFRPRHLAFNGAEGYGRFALGGRGGKVVYVNNLNDSGSGSFREAVTSGDGPRTVVFNVSGVIYLNSRLVCDHFVTIAGQTAPGKGICLRGAPVGVGKESITRFIRVRLGAGTTYDGMGAAGVDNGIIDHCSVSWTIDEAFSSRNGKNLTLQKTLISEALNIAGHANYPDGTGHGYAASIGGDIGTFHHNLLAHCQGRNWSLAGGLDGNGYYAGKLDIFNNVVYNWGGRATDGGAYQVNFVNNYYKKGVASTQNFILNAQLEGTGKGSQSYYYSGNILQNTNGTLACDGTNNTCSRKYTLSNGQTLDWEVFVDKPFFPSYAKIETAKDAFKTVLSDVGCNLPLFDDHDKRIINEVKNGTFTFTGSRSKVGGIIDHQNDAGGYEDYPEVQRPEGFDTDKDGLPDWWENLNGSNVNSSAGDFSDSNADQDKNGYTQLEEYLEWMSFPQLYAGKSYGDTINLNTYFRGFDKPAYTFAVQSDITSEIKDSILTVSKTDKTKGIRYIQVKATDNQGSEFLRTFGICVSDNLPNSNVKIKDFSGNGVYPSMFDSHLKIALNMNSGNNVNVTISDISGRRLVKRSFKVITGDNILSLDNLGHLARQVYILNVTDSKTGENLLKTRVVRK